MEGAKEVFRNPYLTRQTARTVVDTKAAYSNFGFQKELARGCRRYLEGDICI